MSFFSHVPLSRRALFNPRKGLFQRDLHHPIRWSCGRVACPLCFNNGLSPFSHLSPTPDNTTITVVDRDFAGVGLSQINGSAADAWFKTDQLLIHVVQSSVPPPPPPAPICNATQNADITDGQRVREYPNGITKTTQSNCCTTCGKLQVQRHAVS